MEEMDDLEALWEGLLSRQPERIRDAYQSLAREEQLAVFIHLQRMTTETGWHPEQVRSAQKALQVLTILRRTPPDVLP